MGDIFLKRGTAILDALTNDADPWAAVQEVKAWEEEGESEEIVDGLHEAIIDEDLFYRVQDILNKKSPSIISSKSKKFFLKGFLTISLNFTWGKISVKQFVWMQKRF